MSGLTFAATSLVVNPFNKFDLHLHEDESFAFTLLMFPVAFKFFSSLLYCHKDPEDCSLLSEYSIKLDKFIIKLRFSDASICSSFKCATHLVNGLQFLKQTEVLLFPFTTAIFPVPKIYASE